MHDESIPGKLEAFEALCRKKKLALTHQRRVIFQAVLERNDHPTADQVYEAVRERIPGVSRTTVYRVLEMLVELGVVGRLHPSGPAVRFEGKTRRHHHLICRRCQRVLDIEDPALDALPVPRIAARKFRVEDYSVQILGVCGECREKG